MTDAVVSGYAGPLTQHGRRNGGQPLLGQVRQMLGPLLGMDAPDADTDLIETGALDSFALVELLVQVEDRFGVQVPLEDLDIDAFRSAGSIAQLLVQLGVSADRPAGHG